MNFIKKYLENKNVAFYIALGVAVASIVVAIVYGATWIDGSESVGTLVLMIIGALAFVGLSYLNPRIGAASMTGCNVLALAMYINASYMAVFNKSLGGLNLADPEISKIVVFAAFMIVLCIAANVFVWVRMTKKSSVSNEFKED